MKRLGICGLVLAFALPVTGLLAAEGNSPSVESTVVSSEQGAQVESGKKTKKKSRRQGKRKGSMKGKKVGIEKKDAAMVVTPSAAK